MSHLYGIFLCLSNGLLMQLINVEEEANILNSNDVFHSFYTYLYSLSKFRFGYVLLSRIKFLNYF